MVMVDCTFYSIGVIGGKNLTMDIKDLGSVLFCPVNSFSAIIFQQILSAILNYVIWLV